MLRSRCSQPTVVASRDLAACSISSDIAASRRSQLFERATSMRRSTMLAGAGGMAPRTALHKRVDRRRDLDQLAMLLVEAADLEQVGGHDRDTHDQVFVELGRIDIRRVFGDAVRHQADVEALHIARQLSVRPLTEQVDVLDALQP